MLDNIIPGFAEIERRLRPLAPAGFALALNVRYLTPELYHSSFPLGWVQEYSSARYVMFDPVTIWSSLHTGTVRWSEIRLPPVAAGSQRILEAAARHGLHFGAVTVARNDRGQGEKCLLSASRPDRELSDAELAELAEILQCCMAAVGAHAGLSVAEMKTLRHLALGRTHAEIAVIEGITDSAVKKRIERARKALGARNAIHAVAIAARRGLVLPPPFP